MTIRIPTRRSSTQSGAYTWLWDHWDELPSRVPGQTDWGVFARDLTDRGIRGFKGRVLTGEMVRKTFARVEAAKALQAMKAPTPVIATSPPSVPPPKQDTVPSRSDRARDWPPQLAPLEDDDDPPPEFRPVRLRR